MTVVKASDFHLGNSTAEFEQQVNQAFDYFRAKVPGIDDALRAAADKGYTNYNNPDGNPNLPTAFRGDDFFGKTVARLRS